MHTLTLRKVCSKNLTPGASYSLPQVYELTGCNDELALWKVADFEIDYTKNRSFKLLRIRDYNEVAPKYNATIPKDQRRGEITRLRNRVKRKLTLNTEYGYTTLVGQLYGTERHVSRDTLLQDLDKVAYYTIDTTLPKKHKVIITGIKEAKYISKTKREPKEEKSPRIQYTKCLRTLFEDKCSDDFVTYDQLYELYYGLPISEMITGVMSELSLAIQRAAYFRAYEDLTCLNHANSVAVIKNYLLYDYGIKGQRPAGEWEREKIKEIMDEHKHNPSQQFYSAPYYRNFKEAVEEIIPGRKFLGVLVRIEFLSNFLHREIYTPEVVMNAVYTKFDKKVLELLKYQSINPARRKQCYEAYNEWRAKYIEPHLIKSDIRV